jgi:hypothetical protein
MRWLGVVGVVAMLAGPVQADETCVGEGCPRTLEGLLDDLLERVDPLLEEVNPWFRDLGEMLGDLSGWHAPEVLPNGDILIRRRQPRVPSPDDTVPTDPTGPGAPPSDPAPGDGATPEGEGPVTEPLEL